ncbi:hypothetical protein P154DRAFT_597264 [Amniculicola lignicola CBS 123094]|uniref:Uncharacterized protein n=1 Tax=Amniculicola lignicola CBS 123094 TaxID=1392246 RepID=A0A6A5WYI2_9PLEO|nr:hypothetical protein P154DRAFT_597264 [Amniculicola lignicola CBS 123094]
MMPNCHNTHRPIQPHTPSAVVVSARPNPRIHTQIRRRIGTLLAAQLVDHEIEASTPLPNHGLPHPDSSSELGTDSVHTLNGIGLQHRAHLPTHYADPASSLIQNNSIGICAGPQHRPTEEQNFASTKEDIVAQHPLSFAQRARRIKNRNAVVIDAELYHAELPQDLLLPAADFTELEGIASADSAPECSTLSADSGQSSPVEEPTLIIIKLRDPLAEAYDQFSIITEEESDWAQYEIYSDVSSDENDGVLSRGRKLEKAIKVVKKGWERVRERSCSWLRR